MIYLKITLSAKSKIYFYEFEIITFFCHHRRQICRSTYVCMSVSRYYHKFFDIEHKYIHKFIFLDTALRWYLPLLRILFWFRPLCTFIIVSLWTLFHRLLLFLYIMSNESKKFSLHIFLGHITQIASALLLSSINVVYSFITIIIGPKFLLCIFSLAILLKLLQLYCYRVLLSYIRLSPL